MGTKAKVIILEGADGVGKSTLAQRIQKTTKGHILHSSYRPGLDVKTYHETIIQAAALLYNQGDTVIIDRWAPSEYAYGMAFRDGCSYDVDELIRHANSELPITWIYCTNKHAIENHRLNKLKRDEMFSEMGDVIQHFEEFIPYSKKEIGIDWLIYDFDEVNMNQFVERNIDD